MVQYSLVMDASATPGDPSELALVRAYVSGPHRLGEPGADVSDGFFGLVLGWLARGVEIGPRDFEVLAMGLSLDAYMPELSRKLNMGTPTDDALTDWVEAACADRRERADEAFLVSKDYTVEYRNNAVRLTAASQLGIEAENDDEAEDVKEYLQYFRDPNLMRDWQCSKLEFAKLCLKQMDPVLFRKLYPHG